MRRLCLAMQRGNAVGILTAVREKYGKLIDPTDCLLNESTCGCKPSSLSLGLGRDMRSVTIYVFNY